MNLHREQLPVFYLTFHMLQPSSSMIESFAVHNLSLWVINPPPHLMTTVPAMHMLEQFVLMCALDLHGSLESVVT